MRRRSLLGSLTIALLLAGAVSACGTSSPASSKSTSYLQQIKARGYIRIGVLNESPPFGSQTTTGQYKGFEVGMGSLIAKYVLGSSSKVRFVTVNDATRIPLLEEKDVDLVIATMTITSSRQKVIDFSRPYYPSGIGVMVTTNSPIHTYSQLRGQTNCNVTGSLIQPYLLMAMKAVPSLAPVASTIKGVTLPTDGDCLLALKEGRGVQFISNDVGLLIGEAQGTSGLRVLPEAIGQQIDTWGIGIGKGDTQLADAVNSAICSTFKSGEWSKLYSQWIHQSPPAGWPPKC